MTTTTTANVALIPTVASDLYPTRGLDLIVAATWDEDICLTDMQPVEWIELGSWDYDDDRSALDEALASAGYAADWSTLRHGQDDLREVDVTSISNSATR